MAERISQPLPPNKMVAPYMDSLSRMFASTTKTTELEGIVCQGKVTEAMCVGLLQYLKSISPSTSSDAQESTEQLDISIRRGRDKYRLEFKGREHITAFIRGNEKLTSTKIPFRLIVKGFVKGIRPIDIDACDTKVNLKTESEIDTHQRYEVLRSLAGLKERTYRLKKRYSFNTSDKLFRIDITIVRTSFVSNGESALSSGVLVAPKTFEVEIEYLQNDQPPNQTANQLATTLVKHAMELKMALDGDDTYVAPSVRDAILADIKAVFGTDRFIGPMPITLEQSNFVENDYNNDCILNGYTVTEKADGERCLLYMGSIDNTVYKIAKNGGKIAIKRTGMSYQSEGANVLDCEHVTQTRTQQSTSDFMVFDVFSVNGEPVAHLPLLSTDGDCRLHKASELIAKINTTQQHTITVKTFHEDIFKGAQEILALQRGQKYRYHIDGLIYTPKSLPVGALFQGDIPHYGSVWEKVYKWKPPEDNSIDFKVKFVGSPMPNPSTDGTPFIQQMDLYVGADRRSIGEQGRISPFDGLKALASDHGGVFSASGYEDRKFQVEPQDDSVCAAHVHVDPITQKPMCKNGDPIDHQCVVEMIREDGRWVPLRLRRDKIYGNDIHAALNVWRSICQPLTEEVIVGATKIPQATFLSDIEESGIYYNRSTKTTNQSSKQRVATRGIRDFHNNVVKRSLVERLARKGGCKTVFDIACGKAGDIHKYIDNNFNTIIGADKSADNIENASDGAYARTIEIINNPIKSARRERVRTGTIAFFEADFGEKIDGGYMDAIEDTEKRAFIKMLWLGALPQTRNNQAMFNKYRGIVKRHFDMVACQFAIHYFMSSRKSMDAFATNLDNLLKSGGYFVGTCLDGRLVDHAFRSSGSREIRGMRGGRLIWSMENLYGTLDDDGIIHNNFGKKIRVFMETINQPIDEYIVDFDLLVFELGKKGIVPLDTQEYAALGLNNYTGTFRDVFEDMQSRSSNFLQTVGGLMSDEEKQYSFMNRWFIFRKKQVGPPASPITDALVTQSKTTQKQTTPTQTTPQQTTPQQTTPQQTTPQQTTLKQTTPKQTTPKQTTPNST